MKKISPVYGDIHINRSDKWHTKYQKCYDKFVRAYQNENSN